MFSHASRIYPYANPSTWFSGQLATSRLHARLSTHLVPQTPGYAAIWLRRSLTTQSSGSPDPLATQSSGSPDPHAHNAYNGTRQSRGRSTLKDDERFRNGLFRDLKIRILNMCWQELSTEFERAHPNPHISQISQ